MPPEVLSAANGLGFIHLRSGCWVSALDGGILDAGYTSTNKAYTVPHSERSRHYSNINTWTIAVGSSVPKDWPSVLRMFNEIWPSQRGQAWLLWAGETWTVQSTPRGGTIRGPALSWLLPPSEGQLCPLQWCVYHGSLCWGAVGGKGWGWSLGWAGPHRNQICPSLGHSSPWFAQIRVSWATSARAYIRVKNGTQANICNGDRK